MINHDRIRYFKAIAREAFEEKSGLDVGEYSSSWLTFAYFGVFLILLYPALNGATQKKTKSIPHWCV